MGHVADEALGFSPEVAELVEKAGAEYQIAIVGEARRLAAARIVGNAPLSIAREDVEQAKFAVLQQRSQPRHRGVKMALRFFTTGSAVLAGVLGSAVFSGTTVQPARSPSWWSASRPRWDCTPQSLSSPSETERNVGQIDELDRERWAMLRAFYEASGGSDKRPVDMWAAGQKLGFGAPKTKAVFQYLQARNLVTYAGLGGAAAITPYGIDLVEAAERERSKPVGPFPPLERMFEATTPTVMKPRPTPWAFISSVKEGIEHLRDAAQRACLRARVLPIAMEAWTAESRTSLEACKKHLQDSDVVLLLVGARATLASESSRSTFGRTAEEPGAKNASNHSSAELAQSRRQLRFGTYDVWPRNERGPIKPRSRASEVVFS